jgi:hypothetical protein
MLKKETDQLKEKKKFERLNLTLQPRTQVKDQFLSGKDLAIFIAFIIAGGILLVILRAYGIT